MPQHISTDTPGKVLCDGCKKKCRGDVLRVGDRYFHKGCFKCSMCKLNLETGGFFMREDKFYCQDDYQKNFVAKCKICTKDLVGEIVTIMDYSFHRECFICTGCSITFHPGDRVTVWQDRFFCAECTTKHGPSKPYSNGLSVSPNTDEDDEGCCVSAAADASLSDVASPPTTGLPASGSAGHIIRSSLNVQIASPSCTSRQQAPAAVCISCKELPKQSKSVVLRKSATKQEGINLCPTSSQEYAGYLSTDSGLGERFGDSGALGDKLNHFGTDVRQNGITVCTDYDQQQMLQRQSGLGQNQQFQAYANCRKSESLSGRVPTFYYGQHLNHSYLNLTTTQPCAPSERNQYQRNSSVSHLNGCRKSQHFHVPERKPRFQATVGNGYSMLYGRSMSTALHQVTNGTTSSCETGATNGLVSHQGLANSAVELSHRSSKPSPGTRFQDSSITNSATSHTSTLLAGQMSVDHGRDEFTLETKRLAAYPSGQQRDPAQLPPIERLDWPAPPASAVVLAELMRERRHRRQTGDHSATDEHDDDSQDALSIDYPMDCTSGSSQHTNGYLSSSGIGQAILKEESQQKRLSRSHQVLDPVSASRSPNAATEPHNRIRFTTHQFTCHALRPGYTGGQLTEMRKATNSLPASSLALSVGQVRTEDIDWTTTPHRTMPRDGELTSTALSTSLHGISWSPTLSVISPSKTLWSPGGGDHMSKRRSTMGLTNLAYPSVLAPPASSSVVFHKPPPPPPPKMIPYEELKAYKNNAPKGIDGTGLETHLSDEEFLQIFHLSKPIFYRLPEWKRNDLKQRAGIF